MRELRKWLEEKRDAGVREVRVNTVLKKMKELIPPARRNTRNGRVTIMVNVGEIVGIHEAAEILDVDRSRPSKWRSKGTKFGPDRVPFPEPIDELRTGPVFLRSEVEALKPYVEERRRG